MILFIFSLIFLADFSSAAVHDRDVKRQDLTTTALTSLERIITNDELKCIPRLLCEQLAGGTPGQLRGFQFDTKSLFTLLQYLGFDSTADDSPMLGFGKAILLGMANKGDPYACYTKYPHCPRDQRRLLHYLNNHRGGFFRGFSRPYYGRSESRIVNHNKLYLEKLNYERPLIFNEENKIQDFGQSNKLLFPGRRPNSFSFEAVPTDRLPNRQQFPPFIPETDFQSSSSYNYNFFPRE